MPMAASLQQEADFSKLIFLVMDDKPFYRDMAHTAVMRAGAKDVKHAASVESALQIMARMGSLIDGIILDWDVVPVGGLELLRMIRTKAVPKTPPRTPVVILTAKADASAVQAAKALDVNGFALAPLSLEKLVKTIGTGLNRTWTLQDAGVYARVPMVMPSQAVPERKVAPPADGAVHPRARHGTPLSAAAARLHFRDQELKNVRACQLDQVPPGAVLARDLRDKGGQLLLKAGSQLDAPLINRLSSLAAEVWVGEWETPPRQ